MELTATHWAGETLEENLRQPRPAYSSEVTGDHLDGAWACLRRAVRSCTARLEASSHASGADGSVTIRKRGAR